MSKKSIQPDDLLVAELHLFNHHTAANRLAELSRKHRGRFSEPKTLEQALDEWLFGK